MRGLLVEPWVEALCQRWRAEARKLEHEATLMEPGAEQAGLMIEASVLNRCAHALREAESWGNP